MSDITSNDSITAVIEGAFELAQVNGELYDQQWSDRPFGAHHASDEQFLAWWEMQRTQNPPAPITAPDGSQFVASPFELAMTLAVNGQEWLRRYRDALRRQAERAREAIEEGTDVAAAS